MLNKISLETTSVSAWTPVFKWTLSEKKKTVLKINLCIMKYCILGSLMKDTLFFYEQQQNF